MCIDQKLLEWATPRQYEVLSAVIANGSISKAAQQGGLHRKTIQVMIKTVQAKAARAGYSPAHHMTTPVPDGFKAKGFSTLVDKRNNDEPMLQWVKTTADEERQREIMNEAYAAMAAELPRMKPTKAPIKCDTDLCNLVVFTDYHLGQLSWAREGGADWDLGIAEKMLYDAFVYMIDAAPRAETCILCLQGDFMHTDGLLPLTPAHKNVLDADGRFSKIVATAVRVIRRLIDHALAQHRKVHLIIAEGNHDEASSVWMRHMFKAMYEKEKRLTVNNSELPYYAYQHGNTMLAFHHGHKLKPEQLPMLFAAQFHEMWGATTKRYAHCGHRHHTDEKEYSGMIVTQHQTLAARDAHASRGGWIADRAAQVITYHKRYGQRNRVIVCPEMFES